jgi:uncharacterized metal-binding protein
LFLIFIKFFPHRGFFHTIVAGILFSIPLYIILGLQFFIIGFVAFLSHLIADKNLKLMEV